MTTELFSDIVGSAERRWPPSYSDCIMVDCPRCGAVSFQVCINPVTFRRAKVPCLIRMATARADRAA